MNLMTRLNRLFQADLHALLDRLEAPELSLRQALREMEEALSQDSRSLAASEAEAHHIKARLAEIEARRARTSAELESALESGNETLARVLLRRRLQLDRSQRQWHAQIEHLGSELNERREQLAQRRQRLTELNDQAELLTRATPLANEFDVPVDRAISDADVEMALLAEKQRRAS